MEISHEKLKQLALLVRYFSLVSTTAAGSGHPTSSLSATDLMVGLLFGGIFRFNLNEPLLPNNDRLIFSKGHASPLFYALYAVAGVIDEEELKTLRQFSSRLEGHPTPRFVFTEAATGSLGQGLSVGLGMALNAKLDALSYRTYVLLGDSEMAEGSVWEAIQLAAHYKVDNLVGIIDVNRLGQRGETMYGHDVEAYAQRVAAFGWHTIVIDGHTWPEIMAAYAEVQTANNMPTMIIAKTIKGKGVSLLENADGWHGKALPPEELAKALAELGEIDRSLKGTIAEPEAAQLPDSTATKATQAEYPSDQPIATRKAYGNALVRIFPEFPNMVVLDAEVSNSTFSETFKKAHPEDFFEMYIAEQNMVGAALGLSRRGKIPFVSTFAAFLTRAADQIRMTQYSEPNIKFVGSHVGVSIGEDGASQMALEDIALFRTLHKSVVLYPADAYACEQLVEAAARHKGNVYIRTTRQDTPLLYKKDEKFTIGGSKVLRQSADDVVTLIAAGITLHETLAAADELAVQKIAVRVIDLYSIKPLDEATLHRAAQETKAFVTIEDHYPEGGLGEAVLAAVAHDKVPVHILAVRKLPRSGKPNELLEYEEISRTAIVKKVLEIVG